MSVHIGSVTGDREAVVACHATSIIFYEVRRQVDEYQAWKAEYYAKVYPDLDQFLSSNKLIELIRELQLPDEVADIPTENKPVAVLSDLTHRN